MLSSLSILQAQVPDSTLEDKIFTVLSKLDYSALQTGIHIDRSPAWVPVELYDGTLSSDSLKTPWNVFHFLDSQIVYIPEQSDQPIPGTWPPVKGRPEWSLNGLSGIICPGMCGIDLPDTGSILVVMTVICFQKWKQMAARTIRMEHYSMILGLKV